MADETTGGGDAVNRPAWDLDRYKIGEEGIAPKTFSGTRRNIRAEYTADGWYLFWMALRTSIVSVLTLGIYRFWMLAHLRRHYWGGITLRDDPIEYTGTGLEKLLGFLLALIILTVYLGFVQLGLTFAGFSLITDDETQATLLLQLSALATVPLIFFARYRGMRYLMSRSRWRGIRFGMEPGAWGYTVRATLLSTLTILTLGLAYPYQHFVLARYMTNRTWFGDQKFEQGGSWVELFSHWIWIYILSAFIAMTVYTLNTESGQQDWFGIIIAVVIYVVSLVLLYLTILRYRFNAFKALWSSRRLGEVEFESNLQIGDAVKVFITASILTSLAASVTVTVATLIITAIYGVWGISAGTISPEDFVDGSADLGVLLTNMTTTWPVLLGFALTYLLVIAIVFAVSQVFFTHRILRRQVDTMMVRNVDALSSSRQRGHDRAAEAGGFADALGVDVGAGF